MWNAYTILQPILTFFTGNDAHGGDLADHEDARKLPFIGDQLTRVRLQGAKALRRMAPNPVARFDNIGSFLCALWHNKQDFLHVSR